MTLVINDRYELLRTLGGGGMGRVYLAQDIWEPGQLYALKSLAPDAPVDELGPHLRREFQLLSELSHPHVVRVHAFSKVRYIVGEPSGDEPDEPLPTGHPFFVREFVAGSLLKNAAPSQSPETRLRLMMELAGTIAYLHRQGLLHRDIKPDNIMVASPGGIQRQPHVKLLDFGLAAYEEEHRGAAGHAQYLAPELLLGAPADARAEVYALGLTCYELFAGVAPFHGESTAELAKAHAHQTPPPLPQTVPPIAASLIMGMLEKEPARRPSADGVVRALEPLLNPDERRGAVFWSTLGAARLVGRREELALIDELTHSLASPAPQRPPVRAAFFVGPPGIGKSRIMQALEHAAQLEGLRCLRVSCTSENDALAPARGLIEPLLRERPDLITPEREVLRTVFSGRPQARFESRALDVTPRQALMRLQEATRSLLTAIAQEQRLIIILEDLHWIDPETLELFRYLLRHLDPLQTLVVGSSWPAGQSDAPVDRLVADLLPEEGQIRWQELDGLDVGQVRLLIQRTLGRQDLSAELCEQVRTQTEGNPLFIEELLKVACTSGSLEALLQERRLPGAVGEAFRQQLRALSETALVALKGLAVWGTPALSTDLIEITRQSRASCLEGLEEALAFQLIKEVGNGYWFWHAIMVRLVEETMGEEEQRVLHARAGARLEASSDLTDPERIGRLVVHFSRAQESSRALGYALTGARLAADRFLPRRAIELYEQARELSLEVLGRNVIGIAGLFEVRERLANLYAWTGDLSRAESEVLGLLEDPWIHGDGAAQSRLYLLLGDIATRKGELEAAQQWLGTALEARPKGRSAAEVLDKLAEVHLRRGNFEEVLRVCDEALIQLGSDEALVLRGSLAFHRGRAEQDRSRYPEALRHLEEARILYGKAGYLPGQASTLNATAAVYNYMHEYVKARDALLEALELHDQQSDIEGVAITLDRLALATLGLTESQAAITYGKRSVEAWRRLGNTQGEARASNSLGIILHSRGYYKDAFAATEHGLKLYEQIKDPVNIVNAQLTLAIFYLEVGWLERARSLVAQTLEMAEGLGNRLRIARSHHVLGEVASLQGQHEEARFHLQKALELLEPLGNKELLSDLFCAFMNLELRENHPQLALEYGEKAWELVKETGRSANQMLAVLSCGRARLAARSPDLNDLPRLMQELETAGLESLNPDLLWQWWALKGRLALQMGRPRDACRHLAKSMDVIKACYEQLPESLKSRYIGDPRRLAVRQALTDALKLVKG